jgi:hypothetical protein
VYCVLASGMDSRAVVWIRESLLGRTQRVRLGGQLSKEVRVTSGVPQGSVLGPGFESGLEGSCIDKGIPAGPYIESYSRRAVIGGSQSNVRSTARKCTVSWPQEWARGQLDRQGNSFRAGHRELE